MSDERFKEKPRKTWTSLSDYVRHVVDELGTDSQEFKELMDFHEVGYLRQLYRKAKNKGKQPDAV